MSEPDAVNQNDAALLATIQAAFMAAAKKAASRHDNAGRKTPIGMNGRIEFVGGTPRAYSEAPKMPDQVHLDTSGSKWMWIVGGPNGAGKTTLTGELHPRLGDYEMVRLNADNLTATLLLANASSVERNQTNLEAARKIDADVETCITEGKSFIVETVLSTPKYRKDVINAHLEGFRVGFVFISLTPKDLSPERVKLRVSAGGHDVPDAKARARYDRSHEQAAWFANMADLFVGFDNSNPCRRPRVVGFKVGETVVHNGTRLNPALDNVVARLSKPQHSFTR